MGPRSRTHLAAPQSSSRAGHRAQRGTDVRGWRGLSHGAPCAAGLDSRRHPSVHPTAIASQIGLPDVMCAVTIAMAIDAAVAVGAGEGAPDIRTNIDPNAVRLA